MITFSQHFRLDKTQAELDFVDVPVDADIPLFIDPFAISQRPDRFGKDCHLVLKAFFQSIVDYIRSNQDRLALELLQHLREPNETRFGYSHAKPQGAGIGHFQAGQIFQALKRSTAVRTGFIHSLEECELMIEGISRDKISDLTTNILRKYLADYTVEQCALWGIPTQSVALAPYYSPESNGWITDYLNLPIASGGPVLLVPKIFARFDLAYDHRKYYRDFVISYLQAEALDAGSSLVRTLKDGRRVVYKKDVASNFPCTKQNLFQFSKDHPNVLKEYRKELKKLEKRGIGAEIDPNEEKLIARTLAEALNSIPTGNDKATEYHSLMVGIVEFLFYPNLLYPKKEREIHEGRKRIDIVMENGARSGILYRLHAIRDLPCAFVFLECKNYSTDVANPEIDQLAGRFSANRGKFGILCCRRFEDQNTFIKRCRDTFTDDRGLIIPLDDRTIFQFLSLIEITKRQDIDIALRDIIDTVWLN